MSKNKKSSYRKRQLSKDVYRTNIVKKFIKEQFSDDEMSSVYLEKIEQYVYGKDQEQSAQGYKYNVRKGEKLVKMRKGKISKVFVSTRTGKKIQKLKQTQKRAKAEQYKKGFHVDTPNIVKKEKKRKKIELSYVRAKTKLVNTATGLRKTEFYKKLSTSQKKRARAFDPRSQNLEGGNRLLVKKYMDENFAGLWTDTPEGEKKYSELMADSLLMNNINNELDLRIALTNEFIHYQKKKYQK